MARFFLENDIQYRLEGVQSPHRTREENTLIVCHCLNLTDRDIRAGITPPVKNPGTGCCGSCRPTIESMLSGNLENAHPNGS